MPVSYDKTSIPGMRAALAELQRVPAKAAPKLAAKLNGRVNEMFRGGTDPYGNAWAPLAPSTIRRKRAYANPGQILVRARNLWPGTRFMPRAGSGVALVVGPAGEWAGAVTKHKPARNIVPAYGLPALWRADAERIAKAVTREAMKGRK